MAKKLTITFNECLDCPLCARTHTGTGWLCTHAKVVREIDDPNEIPEWCPLEDVEEGVQRP